MRTLVNVAKKKKVFELSLEEFLSGAWKSELPEDALKNPLLEIEYKKNQNILIVKWSEIKETK